MIDWLLSDILCGEDKRGIGWLHDAYLEISGDPVKKGSATDCCTQ